MVGDPLHDLIARRREAKRPAARPAPVVPEGVAIYHCGVRLANLDGEDEAVFHSICGEMVEARPYEPIPLHHGEPMVLAGYDWDRDLA